MKITQQLEEILRQLKQSEPPGADDEPLIDEEAIRARARRAADRMRRERNG